MMSLTEKERQAVLILLKDYTTYHNAHTLSKLLDISHVGVQKLCKRLLAENILIAKTIGKAIVYKPNLKDDFVCKFISFLLAEEAQQYGRWKEEFKPIGLHDGLKKGLRKGLRNGLPKREYIVLMYGSAIKNYAKASDIDLMVIIEEEEAKEVKKLLKEKQEVLSKKLHAITITNNDLIDNLKKNNKAIVNIVKEAVVLYGQDKYVEVLANVTSF